MEEAMTKTDLKIKQLIEKIKTNSSRKRFVEISLIEKMIDIFDKHYEFIEYSKTISDCLEKALQFYKDFDLNYYNMLVNGIKEKRILINGDFKSYVDTGSNNAYIKLCGNDSDLFILVHEFAHFIDRNSNPIIVPNNLKFLAEVYSFYMEKKLELWLNGKGHDDLITTRRNNRIFYEAGMLRAIKSELHYENLFKRNGKLEKEDILIEDANLIMKYDVSNSDLVDYLLRYPLANILSDYLIDNNFDLKTENLCEECLQTNLYFVLDSWQKN